VAESRQYAAKHAGGAAAPEHQALHGCGTGGSIAMKHKADGQKLSADGRRRRRHSPHKAKREWYAKYRALRFARHLGF